MYEWGGPVGEKDKTKVRSYFASFMVAVPLSFHVHLHPEERGHEDIEATAISSLVRRH